MHKREILRLYAKVKQDGYALVPLSVYFKGGHQAVEVGLCKGKKLYDKRDCRRRPGRQAGDGPPLKERRR